MNEGTSFKGTDRLVTGGYDGVVAGLLKDLDVKLNSIVTEIDYSDSVTVKLADGSEIKGDFVVCTLPLGVLKAKKVKFTPQLPAAKLKAMEHLDMGVLNKFFFEFPEVFWEKDVEWIGKVPKMKGMWQGILNLYFHTGKPMILMFTGANVAREIEKWTDE